MASEDRGQRSEVSETDLEMFTPPLELSSISSARQRVISKVNKSLPQSGKGLRSILKDQTRSTRFDEPPSSPSASSSHPPTLHSSRLTQEGRGTSLRWQRLSERLPEAIEKTVEDQSYQSYQFFTGTAEDIELPEVRKRVRREEGGGEGGEEGGEEGGGEGGEEGGEEGGGEEGRREEGGGAGEEEDERDEPIIGARDYDQRDTSLQQHQEGGDGGSHDNGGHSDGGHDYSDHRDGSHDDGSHDGDHDDSEQSKEDTLFGGQRSLQLLRPPRTMYIPQRVREQWEESVCFTPSTVPAAVEDKTPSSLPPRHRDDEGLYVGRRPEVKRTNHIAVENRLLQRPDRGRGWFGEDGLLLTLPDPLTETRLRPTILAHDPTRNIELVPARTGMINRKLIPHGPSRYQLDLTLSTLHFSHHPLYTREHVLASRLKRACNDYTQLMDSKATDYLLQRLYALKTAVVDLRSSLHDMDGMSREAVDTYSTLQRYSRDIRALRRERRESEVAKYRLLQLILRTWSDLKTQRDSQGHSNTTLCITFTRQAVDFREEEALLLREIAEEVEEEGELYEADFAEREAAYHTQLAEWRTHRKLRRRAIRRRERRLHQSQQSLQDGQDRASLRSGEGEREGEERGEEEGSVTASLASLRQDSVSNSLASIPEERPRPTPPAPFDPEQCWSEIAEFQRQSCRPPGEAILLPVMQHTHPITQQCTRAEQIRRMEVSRAKLKVKVFYNDQEVSKAEESALSQDFCVHFNETFHIEIVQWPESIRLQILECSLFTSTLLAEVYVPIPDSQQSRHCSVPETYQFSSDRVVSPFHTAVGSGEINPSLPETGILVTSGGVSVRVCWSEDEEGRTLCPSVRPTNERLPGTTDLKTLKKWAEESRIDPNDPKNIKLLHLLQSVPTTEEGAGNVFMLQQLHDRERLVGDDEFARDRRFALLEHRQQGHPHLKNKSIPMDKEHISGSQWKAVQEYQPYKDYELPPTYQGDFHGNRREERNRFLLEVRERVLSRVRSGRQTLQIDDIIHYDIIPNISGLKGTILELISPRRPLKPRRKPTRKAKAQNVQISEAKIVVRLVRAYHVPVRGRHEERSRSRPRGHSMASSHPPSSAYPHLTSPPPHSSQDDDTGSTPHDEGLHTVCPYVEVAMGDNVQRTATASGPNPFWNEELTLPFQPPYGDFSPANLAKVTDSIQLNLFDELTVDLLQDDRERGTNIHQRREKKWLGSFTFPFSTLHARSRIEGTFAMEVPKLLLGYDHAPSDHTHLQFFISLEPPLSSLPPIKDLFTTSEEPHLLRHANQWLKKLQSEYPTRQYLATPLDSSGCRVFVSRYIHPQSPPVQLCPTGDSNQRQAMELLAHYVSLIPFLPDAIAFSGECDIWTTSEQFVHMLAGDEEEHAILLTNYFLHCGWQAWLVLGSGLPEGPTAYVLTHTPGEVREGGGGGEGVGYWLWNASTGKHSSQYDPHCPLSSVGCIIGMENVWGNIQEYSDPGRIGFDLSNSKNWQPLFPNTVEPLDTIQQELVYTETESSRVRDLQDGIERAIRDHVMSLRTRFITRWNTNCGRALNRMLIRYEENLFDPRTFENTSELDEITASYKLSGFPLHFHYADIVHIVTSIERTGLHLTEDRQVEFALSVYVYPYPNDVVSVWVFLVTMAPK